MVLRQKVMSGLRWTAGAKFVSQLITWGITIVVIRILSPEDYGLMELATVFVAFLAMLNELGLGAAVVQRKNLDNDTLRSLFFLVLLAGVFFYLLLATAAPMVAAFYQEPRLVPLVQVLALQFLLMGFTVLPSSLLLREMAFRKIAIVDFVSAIAGSLTTLALVLSGYGVWALVWGSLAIRIVSMVGLNIAQPFLYLPRIDFKGTWEYFTFGGYVTLTRIIWYFYISADALIIGKVLGSEMLGFYAVGLYLASLPMEKVAGIVNQVALPAFSSVQSDIGLAGRHFLKAVRVMSFFAFPVLWGISCIAPEIVELFLSTKWSQAAIPLQIISLVIPLRMVSSLMNPAVLGVGRPDISFHNALVAFLLMPISFWLGSFWGLTGVSLAWVTVFPLVFYLNLSRAAKALEIRFRDVLTAMQRPCIAGALMYGGVLSLNGLVVAELPIVPRLVILIACGAVIYIVSTLLLNRGGLREVRNLAGV